MSEAARQQTLLGNLFAAIDAKDTAAFVGFLDENARFRFGSAPTAVGRQQIAAAVDGFFASISALQHDVAMTMANDDALVCEGEVTYTRLDGSTISLPFTDVFNFSGGLISNYKIYMDIAPLYAES